MHLGISVSQCIFPDSSSAHMGGQLKSPFTSSFLVRKTVQGNWELHSITFKVYPGNANSERRENSNDLFYEKILCILALLLIHTMCEGVLYFQYVCGHDDLIKHKKGHFSTKVKYVYGYIVCISIRIASCSNMKKPKPPLKLTWWISFKFHKFHNFTK